MNEINDNNIQELNEIRNQLRLLKQKLNEQEIVNEKLMRKVTRERLSKINREGKIYSIIAAICVPINYLILQMAGTSTAFNIVTILYLLVCIGVSVYSRRGINPEDVINGNLVTTKKKMLTYKALCNKWLIGVTPFLLVWFGWFMYELAADDSDFNTGAIVGGCVGAAVGTICGIIYHKKSMKNIDNAIQEITELTNE